MCTLYLQYAGRNIEENKVLAASMRKLKHMRKRWFVLYSASDKSPAHLEVHDNERNWRESYPPKRDVILEDCFNICKKQDTRDSKNKHVVAIYTLKDCLSILFEEEQELKTWLVQLLSHQKGTSDDGRMPKPTFENMWQVMVKYFKAENADNTFVMTGPHRLVVTMEDLKFFPMGATHPTSFPIVSVRSCQCNDRIFQVVTGRGAPSGPGTLFVHVEDKEISANLLAAVTDVVKLNSTNNTARLSRTILEKLNKSKDTLPSSPMNSESTPTAASSSSSHRPRSESW